MDLLGKWVIFHLSKLSMNDQSNILFLSGIFIYFISHYITCTFISDNVLIMFLKFISFIFKLIDTSEALKLSEQDVDDI